MAGVVHAGNARIAKSVTYAAHGPNGRASVSGRASRSPGTARGCARSELSAGGQEAEDR